MCSYVQRDDVGGRFASRTIVAHAGRPVGVTVTAFGSEFRHPENAETRPR